MSSWQEVLLGLAPAPERLAEPEGRRRGFFSRLRENLGRSSRALAQGLNELAFDPNDDDVWERLEELLIAADVGVPATVEIVQALEAEAAAGRLHTAEELNEALRRSSPRGSLSRSSCERSTCAPAGRDPCRGRQRHGEETTIGKLAYQLNEAGASVVVGAGDKFRAAAVGAARDLGRPRRRDFVGRPAAPTRPPSPTTPRAASRAVVDVVIVDTAGRLHTQEHLMEELEKVRRVIAQRLPGAPHETLLTIDATTGQNGLQQARLFTQAAEARASC